MSPLALTVLGLIAFLRESEVAFSAWRIHVEKRAAYGSTQASTSPVVEAIPERVFPWMVAVHGGWYVATAAESFWAPATYGAYGSIILWTVGLIWAASLLLRVWLWANLGRLWNVRIVNRADQPIVTHGPYRWVRHPNYLAVILEIAAVPLLLGAPWTALAGTVANGLILIPRIRREEAYLFSVPGYKAAFAAKKRFLPGLY